MEIILGNTTVQLLYQKALFLPEQQVLVIADLHLGKAMHFRKAGIFLPAAGTVRDYQVLNALIEAYKPLQVWFLGDLFHSLHNSEWQQLETFIHSREHINFTLIRGNHDIIKKDYYDQLGMTLVPHILPLDNLLFSHEPLAEVEEGKINIAGHIHPGCSVRGKGRQSYRFPCFHFSGQHFLLPAFGYLTGLQMMETKDAAVFAVLPEQVILL